MSNLEILTKLAHDGDADAQYKLALMYELGLAVNKDWALALAWYQKSAHQNHPKAQYNLGIFYALAKGVEKDIQQSKHWIKKANENGYSGTSIF